MKQGKRPTKQQKIAMQLEELNPKDWLVTKSLPDKLHIVHKETNQQLVIPA
ncbi:hypothetical protein JQN58_05000 [Aneurinibacillus sp. BA2021]|nr:hypothetical protein [Aneurinibacillus sp. BA2021]